MSGEIRNAIEGFFRGIFHPGDDEGSITRPPADGPIEGGETPPLTTQNSRFISTSSCPNNLNGLLQFQVNARIPGRGANPRLPTFTYSDPTRYPLRSSPQMNLTLGPNQGNITALSDMRVNCGRVDLSHPLLHVYGLSFRDVDRDSSLFLRLLNGSMGFRRQPYNIHFFPGLLVRNERGDLDLIGDVAHYNSLIRDYTIMTGYADYPSEVLWRESLPLGLNAEGALVCASANRGTVTQPFPTLAYLRDHGLPASLDLETLANIGEEFGQASTAGQCPLPDRLRLNLPARMIQNPLAFVPHILADGRFTINGTSLAVPADGQHQRPGVAIGFSQPGGSVAFHMEADNEPRPGDSFTNLRANLGAHLPLSSIQVGGRTVTVPVQVDENLRINVNGNVFDPRNLAIAVTSNGRMDVNGDLTYEAAPREALSDLERLFGPSPVLGPIRSLLNTVPIPAAIPVVVLERNGPNYLVTRALRFVYAAGAVSVHGQAEGNLDLRSIHIPALGISTGPVSSRINIHGTDHAIVADIAAHAVLPRASFPAPISVAIERGWFDIPQLQLWLAQWSSPQDFTIGLSGEVRLGEVAGSVAHRPFSLHELAVRANGQTHVVNGRVDASAHLDVAVSHAQGTLGTLRFDANLGLSGDIRIQDFPSSDPRHGHAERVITITNGRVPFDLRLQNLPVIGNLQATSGEGTMVDAPPAPFEGQRLPSGVQITSRLSGQPILGHHAYITVNRQVNNLRISTSMGNVRVSGQLVGHMEMVNISPNPMRPDLRPLVGTLRYEIRHARIQDGNGRTLVTDHGLRIQDNANGEIIVSDHHDISLEPIPAQLRRMLGIPDRVDNRLNIPLIRFNPGVATTQGAEEVVVCTNPASHASRATTVERHYDLSHINQVCVPSAILQSTMNRVGALVTSASVCISGIQSGEIQSDYRIRAGFRGLRMHVTLPEQHLAGEVQLLNGALSIRGNQDRATASLQIPGVRINNTTVQRDGITYTLNGTLRPASSVLAQIRIDPQMRAENIRIPERAHPLSGDLDVIATNASGQVIGRGHIHAETSLVIFGNIGATRSRIRVQVPDLHIAGSLPETIQLGVNPTTGRSRAQIPGGSEVDLHIEGFAVDTTANLGLRRH